MLEFFHMGGIAMWLLLVASLLATYVFFERFFHFHRAQIDTKDFMDGILNVLRRDRDNIAEALSICEDSPGPLPHIVRAALLKADDEPEDFALAIQQAGLSEIPRLEHRLGMLAGVARCSTLIGLLGTLVGLVVTTGVIAREAPVVHIDQIAHGMHQALISSIVGISISIMAHAGYNLLVGRMEAIIRSMENIGAEIYTHLLRRHRRGKTSRTESAS